MMRADLVLALVAGGCGSTSHMQQPRPVNHHFATRAEISQVRRVLVVPFLVADGLHANEASVRRQFVTELEKLQRFEVIDPGNQGGDLDRLRQDALDGRLEPASVTELQERYRADAVLLATITHHRPYLPAVLGLRTQIVNLHSGRPIWAAEGLYDADDLATHRDLLQFCARMQTDDESRHGWEMTALSPQRFARYVSFRLLATWQSRSAAPAR
jgi:hypothetical protein